MHSAQSQGAIGLSLLSDGRSSELLRIPDVLLVSAAYCPTGHLLYQRVRSNVGIWAAPFSIDEMKLTGEPFLVTSNGVQCSVSGDGTLVFRQGGGSEMRQLMWVDRQGNVLERIGQPQVELANPALAPDQNRIAISVGRGMSTPGFSFPRWRLSCFPSAPPFRRVLTPERPALPAGGRLGPGASVRPSGTIKYKYVFSYIF